MAALMFLIALGTFLFFYFMILFDDEKEREEQEKQEAMRRKEEIERQKREAERRKAEMLRKQLADARADATKVLRDAFQPIATLIEPLYTSTDLNEDLARQVAAAASVTDVRARAKALAAKIDRYRAYETVRAAYRAEVEILGAHFPYESIAEDVERILAPDRPTTEVRSSELILLGRIKRLARHYREHPALPHQPPASIDDAAAAIECEVRSEARPEDTEEDIRREIAHRRGQLYRSSPPTTSHGESP